MQRQFNATTTQTLALLNRNKGVYLSGQDLAESLNVSRAAIWKAIVKLREAGYPIEASTNKGYYLAETADVFNRESVQNALSAEAKEFYNELVFFNTIESTNTYVKEERRIDPEGLVVVAETQTAGRGRFDRSFYCRKGAGVYFSILLRPCCPIPESPRITSAAAVAAAKACEKVASELNAGDVKIKWVNDLYLHEKKICGILTEATTTVETGKMDFAVLGVGINLVFDRENAPQELTEAGGLFETEAPIGARTQLLAEFLNEFYLEYVALFRGDSRPKAEAAARLAQEYRARQYLVGRKVDVVENLFEPTKTRSALAVDVDDDFRLLVRYDDAPETLVALNGGETRAR